MTAFDANFKDKVYLSSSLPFYKFASIAQVTDTPAGPSILKKRLVNPNFEVQLSYGGADSSGQLKKAISFDGFEDLLNFWSCHKIRAGLDGGLFNNGTFHITTPGTSHTAKVAGTHTFYGEMMDTWSIYLEVDNWDWENVHTYISIGDDDFHYDYSESGSGGGAIVTDHTVFEELLGKKEIVINNVD